VAGGVFAQQGEWSLGGGVKLGATADFNAASPGDPNKKVVYLTGDGEYPTEGNLDATYDRGDGLKITLGFGVSGYDSGHIDANVEYSGDRYALQAKAPVSFLLLDGAKVGGQDFELIGISNLWGYYELLNGLVHLEGAYKGRDNGWWESDTTAGSVGANLNGKSGVLTNVSIDALQFGILVPDIFGKERVPFIKDDAIVDLNADPPVDGNGALLNSVIGIKFSMSPIEFAAQFGFHDYNVYFGGKWFIVPDVLTLGASFHGIMKDTALVKAGLKVNYDQDVFGAEVAATFLVKPRPTQLDIAPSFYYKVIPDYLYFKTSFGLTFFGKKNPEGWTPTENDIGITWRISPELSWNFLGTGAKGYGDLNTGMGIKFTLESKNDKTIPDPTLGKSQLYVGFKWGF